MRSRSWIALVAAASLVVTGYLLARLRPVFASDGSPTTAPAAPRTSEEKEAEARKRLPFKSITDRLPKGEPVSPAKPLSEEAKRRWESLDHDLTRQQTARAELLKALHDRTRNIFVQSPGEGVSRMPLETRLYEDHPWNQNRTDQPGPWADVSLADEPWSPVAPREEFHSHHKQSMLNFLHAIGFGYVKDPSRVAGFSSHGFRAGPWANPKKDQWRIEHVLLVGILINDQPVVYLTEKLPSMEEAREAKVRPLDRFEAEALASLREGEDLVTAEKDGTLRMVGALRATQSCLQCHDAEVGDLLGALSYTLRPAPVKDDGGK